MVGILGAPGVASQPGSRIGTMKFLGAIFAVLLLPGLLEAGPPFVTDDPEPVEYKHWEVYVASQLYRDGEGWTGTAPQVEVNYGVAPNLQLHTIVSDAFSATSSHAKAAGFGDVELGAKFRFVQQSRFVPEVATFPLLELPTASERRGLGDDHLQAYFPLWMQKDFGKWTAYGGGGYWINPGANNKNWGFVGLLLQRKVTDQLTLGAEVFHQTVQVRGGDSSTYINPGGIWDLNDLEHILFSVGHTVQGQNGYQAYVAIQFTFGPKGEAGAAPSNQ
jgi:hypothetical protein